MAAFPNPTHPDREDDEVIYDDWGENGTDPPPPPFFKTPSFLTRGCGCGRGPDCPQVQCVEQYTAQQTDELTLEPTEIINVIRKTNEGKTRLHGDGSSTFGSGPC